MKKRKKKVMMVITMAVREIWSLSFVSSFVRRRTA
ncbi:unnamed protein product [Victoria cruziana]